jgi:hypothetical protein
VQYWVTQHRPFNIVISLTQLNTKVIISISWRRKCAKMDPEMITATWNPQPLIQLYIYIYIYIIIAPWRRLGECIYRSTNCLLGRYFKNGQLYSPAALTLGKGQRYAVDRGLDDPRASLEDVGRVTIHYSIRTCWKYEYVLYEVFVLIWNAKAILKLRLHFRLHGCTSNSLQY